MSIFYQDDFTSDTGQLTLCPTQGTDSASFTAVIAGDKVSFQVPNTNTRKGGAYLENAWATGNALQADFIAIVEMDPTSGFPTPGNNQYLQVGLAMLDGGGNPDNNTSVLCVVGPSNSSSTDVIIEIWISVGGSTSIIDAGNIVRSSGDNAPQGVAFGMVGQLGQVFLKFGGTWVLVDTWPAGPPGDTTHIDLGGHTIAFATPGGMAGFLPAVGMLGFINGSGPSLASDQFEYIEPFTVPGFSVVPDVVGESQAAATSDILSAGLVLGTVTVAPNPAHTGNVFDQSPAAGTTVSSGSGVDISVSEGFTVPDVVGEPREQASADLIIAGFVVGEVDGTFNPAVAGTVISQNPVGGTQADAGSTVSYIVSNGPAPPPAFVVPNLVGLTAAQATQALIATGFMLGLVGSAPSGVVLAGTILSQSPPSGTILNALTPLNYVLSTGEPLVEPFDFEQTVISQYANSPTILQLVSNMNEYIRQDLNFQMFFDFVWNVNTAQGFGLDIWGSIVGISRLLEIPSDVPLFGFRSNVTPPGVRPFNFGVFNAPGLDTTSSFLLPDEAYRILILTKALANISATNAPSINQLLQNLFPGRGNAYVLDLGNMHMQFTFDFELSLTEFAILSQSGALPHPAGVSYSIVSIPQGIFGFVEALPDSEPFGFGTLYAAP